MTVVVSVQTTPVAQTTVYHTTAAVPGDYDDTYYFCCNTCGNCGRRWTGRSPATDEATRHVTEAHPVS